MTRCIELDCRRPRIREFSRCENHLRALLARVFGRSAEYPVRAAA